MSFFHLPTKNRKLKICINNNKIFLVLFNNNIENNTYNKSRKLQIMRLLNGCLTQFKVKICSLFFSTKIFTVGCGTK